MDTPLLVLVRRLSAASRLDGPAGLAALHLDDDALIVAPDAPSGSETRRVVLRVNELAGLTVGTHPEEPEALVLYPLRGVAVAVQPRDPAHGSDLLAIGRRAERRAFALPELTRGLRAVGARRGAPGDDHDRWFGGLLAARQAAARADGWTTQLAAFAPDSLRGMLAGSLASLATSRHPASPPDQRALVAALEEYASPLERALDDLARADQRLHAATDAERLVAWRAWVTAARNCFAAADRGWLAMAPLLARHAPAAPPSPAPARGGARRVALWWRPGGAGGRTP